MTRDERRASIPATATATATATGLHAAMTALGGLMSVARRWTNDYRKDDR